MMEGLRLLVLTASVGAGHTKAAEAIQKALNDRYPQVKVDLVDTFSFAGPKIGKMIFGSYLTMIKRFPAIYGYMYRKSEGDTWMGRVSQQELVRLMTWTMAKPLRNLVEANQYHGIICTHPFPLGIVSRLKGKLAWQMPLQAVITDFTAHHCWVYPNVTTYYVAHPKVSQELMQQRVPVDRIQVTGIPIDSRFAIQPDKKRLLTQLGLSSDRPVILVMGGGLGWGPLQEVAQELGRSSLPCQLVVVAGTNRALYHNLHQQAEEFNLPMKVLGYIDFVPELLAIADLLVTKPGGLTASEALARQVPMIIPGVIAGHEESNAQFLLEQRAAILVNSPSEVVTAVAKWLQKDALAGWKASLASLSYPQAACSIAEVAFKEAGTRDIMNLADMEKVME